MRVKVTGGESCEGRGDQLVIKSKLMNKQALWSASKYFLESLGSHIRRSDIDNIGAFFLRIVCRTLLHLLLFLLFLLSKADILGRHLQSIHWLCTELLQSRFNHRAEQTIKPFVCSFSQGIIFLFLCNYICYSSSFVSSFIKQILM